MKDNTLYIEEPSKELLEFARGLRANKQEKRSKKKFNYNRHFNIKKSN